MQFFGGDTSGGVFNVKRPRRVAEEFHFVAAVESLPRRCVTTDLRHMQDQFNNLYTAPIVDENFYKVITATKILNHKIQGDFFPMVEMQSGSGRIDMALISHDTHPSGVVF